MVVYLDQRSVLYGLLWSLFGYGRFTFLALPVFFRSCVLVVLLCLDFSLPFDYPTLLTIRSLDYLTSLISILHRLLASLPAPK